jgi:hypothetical protein
MPFDNQFAGIGLEVRRHGFQLRFFTRANPGAVEIEQHRGKLTLAR